MAIGISVFLSAFNLHTAVFFSRQSLCLMHTGKPTGVAVSHCITWFQTQLIHTTCHIRHHSHCGSGPNGGTRHLGSRSGSGH